MQTQVAVLSGRAIKAVLDFVHRVAHAEGGCDERPVLYAALVVKELEGIIELYPEDQRLKVLSDLATHLSFTAATHIEKLIQELKAQAEPDVVAILNELTAPPEGANQEAVH